MMTRRIVPNRLFGLGWFLQAHFMPSVRLKTSTHTAIPTLQKAGTISSKLGAKRMRHKGRTRTNSAATRRRQRNTSKQPTAS